MKSPIDGSDPRWIGWNRTFAKKFDFSKYDTIELTEAVLKEMCESMYEVSSIDVASFFDTPAISEFTLRITDSLNGPLSVCFKKTIMPKSGIICGDRDSLVPQVAFPKIDAYVDLDGGAVSWVINIGCVVNGDEKVFMNWPVWSRNNADPSLVTDFPQFTQMTNAMYASIQQALYDRPAMFVETTRRITTENNGKKKNRPNKRNNVKTIRIIRLRPEDEEENGSSKREITCPSWGVIGHWRHYKNGTKVWIEPYRKGKQRENPEAYCAKDYELIREEEPVNH